MESKGKASAEELEQLHGKLVRVLLKKLDSKAEDIDPRDLATTARVLKDNEQTVPPPPANPRGALDRAAASLPTTDEPYDQEERS